MKSRIIVCLGSLVMFTILLWYGCFFEPLYQGLLRSGEKQTILFAHRGFGNHAPDNSLTGAKLALAYGLDGVDVDAQFSKDHQAFIFHDVTLDRFATGTGRVDGYTLAELKQFDLGAKYGDGTEFQNVFIESFEKFVQTITPEALLMVELKIATAKNTGMEQAVIDILSANKAFEKVYISSFNPVVIYRLKQLDARVQTVFIFQDSGWDAARVAETNAADRVALPWYLQTEWTRRLVRKIIRPDALSINERVSEATIDKLQKQGWPIFLWSLNTPETIEWGMEKQPYGIITDEPIILKDLVDSKI